MRDDFTIPKGRPGGSEQGTDPRAGTQVQGGLKLGLLSGG